MTCHRFGRLIVLLGVILSVGASASAQRKDIGVQPAGGTGRQVGYSNSWALVIGINRYQHPGIEKLRAAVSDAKAMKAVLPSLGFTRIISLLDQDATRARIEQELYGTLKQMGPNDRLLIFFSGHSKRFDLPKGGEEAWLMPVDADPNAPEQTGIPLHEFDRIGRRLPAKHVLFILDTHYSGFMFLQPKKIVPMEKDAFFAAQTASPVVQALTAGKSGEVAYEGGGQGLFTRRLIEGLQGTADSNKDGLIPVGELLAFVVPWVSRDTNGQQNPQGGRLSGEGEFIFVRTGVTGPGGTASLPPKIEIHEEVLPQFGSLAINAKVPGAEVWLDDQQIGETKAGRVLVVGKLPVGTHRVKASKGGYKEWEQEVKVAADARAEAVIDLEPLRPESPGVIQGNDGAEMVLVPAGEFTMGSPQGEGNNDEHPQHRVNLDAFYLDKYEVTNARYRRCVEAGSCTPPKSSWLRMCPKKYDDPQRADHPVVCVDWEQARAYCSWTGKRLPTEAEWEKAARGTDGRVYPWGNDFGSGHANIEGSGGGYADTAPVGSFPSGASPYGALDMAGNVWEWVADWYDKNYYTHSPSRTPNGPDSGKSRVLRGGSWAAPKRTPQSLARAALRYGSAPSWYSVFGFRCAQDFR